MIKPNYVFWAIQAIIVPKYCTRHSFGQNLDTILSYSILVSLIKFKHKAENVQKYCARQHNFDFLKHDSYGMPWAS